MKDERISDQEVEESVSITRIERLLERLKELWQYPHEITFETLKRILVDLPKEDQRVGLEVVSEHLVSLMKVHFLDIVATFHQKAEEEGINTEEREEIAYDIRHDALQALQKLKNQLSIQSIDDLIILSNITFGLYGLSQIETAEQAERWMYKLPKMYSDRLEQEHLVIETLQVTTVSTSPSKSITFWNTALSQSSTNLTWKYETQESVQVPPRITYKSSPLVA